MVAALPPASSRVPLLLRFPLVGSGVVVKAGVVVGLFVGLCVSCIFSEIDSRFSVDTNQILDQYHTDLPSGATAACFALLGTALAFAAMETGVLDVPEDISETSAFEAAGTGPVEFGGRDPCVATMARGAVVRAGSAFFGVESPAPAVVGDAVPVLISGGRGSRCAGVRAGVSAAASGVAGC